MKRCHLVTLSRRNCASGPHIPERAFHPLEVCGTIGSAGSRADDRGGIGKSFHILEFGIEIREQENGVGRNPESHQSLFARRVSARRKARGRSEFVRSMMSRSTFTPGKLSDWSANPAREKVRSGASSSAVEPTSGSVRFEGRDLLAPAAGRCAGCGAICRSSFRIPLLRSIRASP